MESYRVKNQSQESHKRKRFFLPLSGGVSSLSLLHVLDVQLNEQIAKQNWRVYDLLVVHIDLLKVEEDVSKEWYEGVARRFSLHEYLDVLKIHEAFRVDETLEGDLLHLGLKRPSGADDEEFYHSILSSTTSVTTRSDLTELLLKRILVSIAKQQNCDRILWGHSDSRLAAHALSEVAKGRGAAVPDVLTDGGSSDGLASHHPIRDLFLSELELYASILSPPLETLPSSTVDEPVISIRNTSIDSLLNKYITSQGEKYPSIMANVVRTASKLQVPAKNDHTAICPVCQCVLEEQNEDEICYGCRRMKQDIKI